MPQDTAIAWADDSISWWWGCTHDGPGCLHCYAEALSKRVGQDAWGPSKPRYLVKSAEKNLGKLNDLARAAGRRRVVFINSMSDFFEEHHGPVVDWKGNIIPGESLDTVRARAFTLFEQLDWLYLLLLTKRPENIRQQWRYRPCEKCHGKPLEPVDVDSRMLRVPMRCGECGGDGKAPYRFNAWLGTSVAVMKDLPNIATLLQSRDLAQGAFVSIEPIVEAMSLRAIRHDAYQWDVLKGERRGTITRDIAPFLPLDWGIIGGESGGSFRGCEVQWIADLALEFKEAGTPLFIKQDCGLYPGKQGRLSDELWGLKQFPAAWG